LGKAPSPKWVIVQFFLAYWPLIKAYYKKMVRTSIPCGKFPPWCHTYVHNIESGKDRYLGIGDLSPYSMPLINFMQKFCNLGSNQFRQKILATIKLYFCLCNCSWITFPSFMKHQHGWKKSWQPILLWKLNFLKPSTKFHGLTLFSMKKFGIGTSFTNMILLLFCDSFAQSI
jgi:hypothetical protein